MWKETPLSELPKYMDLLVNTASRSFYSGAGDELWQAAHINSSLGQRLPPHSNELTVYVGCYNEGEPRLFPLLAAHSSNVSLCASLARQHHSSTFALQRHGECWLAPNQTISVTHLAAYGESQQCTVDCESSRLARRQQSPIRLAALGALCGNAKINTVYAIKWLDSSTVNSWLQQRLAGLQVMPHQLLHHSIRLIPPPAVFQLQASDAPWADSRQSLHTLLRVYARFLRPPWKQSPSSLGQLEPRACNLNSCWSTCCCHPCADLHPGVPADNQLLFPAPLASLEPEIASLDSALDRASAAYFSYSAELAPPPLPGLPVVARVALLLSGEMRTFASTLPWMRHHLIDSSPYPVDLFLHAWEDDTTHAIRAVLRANGLEEKALRVERQPPCPLRLSDAISCRKAEQVDSIVLAMSSESLRRAHRLKRLEEHRMQAKYTWVVRMRYDIALRHNVWPAVTRLQAWPGHPATQWGKGDAAAACIAGWSWLRNASLDAPRVSSLVYPACGGWGGLNDQFAMGESDAMHAYCEKPRYI